jgi:hypothetical protein
MSGNPLDRRGSRRREGTIKTTPRVEFDEDAPIDAEARVVRGGEAGGPTMQAR